MSSQIISDDSLVNSEVSITTMDNPYNPFENFRAWWLFDVEKGYNTCAYLARIAKVSESFSDFEVNSAIENAIDEILKYDVFGIYKKVYRKDYENSEDDTSR